MTFAYEFAAERAANVKSAPLAPIARPRFLLPIFCALTIPLLLGGCLNGDFGRVSPSLVSDNTHDWVGRRAAIKDGRAPSTLPLTDDERRLRDLAYPLIEPPYDRGRWDAVLREWGITRNKRNSWPPYDTTVYGRKLLTRSYRSDRARYAQLVEDIHNDVVRIGPFFATAGRVLDMDDKRARSFAYVSGLTAAEQANAQRRNAENALVVAWVERSLRERVASYDYALQHLVVATPSPMALEAERTLRQLQQQIAGRRFAATSARPLIAVAAR